MPREWSEVPSDHGSGRLTRGKCPCCEITNAVTKEKVFAVRTKIPDTGVFSKTVTLGAYPSNRSRLNPFVHSRKDPSAAGLCVGRIAVCLTAPSLNPLH